MQPHFSSYLIVSAALLCSGFAVSIAGAQQGSASTRAADVSEIGTRQTKVIRRRNADAAELSRRVAPLFDDVQIAADPRSDSLIVLADKERMEKLTVIVQNVDALSKRELATSRTSETPADISDIAPKERKANPQTKVIRLRNANAKEFSRIIPRFDDVQIAADPRSNSLIILADEERMRSIAVIVEKLDFLSARIDGSKR